MLTRRASDSTERTELLRSGAPLRAEVAEARPSDALGLCCSSALAWLAATLRHSSSEPLRPDSLGAKVGSTAELPALLSCSTRELSSTCEVHQVLFSSTTVLNRVDHRTLESIAPPNRNAPNDCQPATHPVQVRPLLRPQRATLLCSMTHATVQIVAGQQAGYSAITNMPLCNELARQPVCWFLWPKASALAAQRWDTHLACTLRSRPQEERPERPVAWIGRGLLPQADCNCKRSFAAPAVSIMLQEQTCAPKYCSASM